MRAGSETKNVWVYTRKELLEALGLPTGVQPQTRIHVEIHGDEVSIVTTTKEGSA